MMRYHCCPFRLVFIIALFSCSSNYYAKAHDTIRPPLSKAEFEKLKSDYVKMENSTLFKRKRKAFVFYFDHMTLASSEAETNADRFKKWLELNLNKTRFKSVKEGVKAYRKLTRLEQRVWKRNKATFRLMARANPEQEEEVMALMKASR